MENSITPCDLEALGLAARRSLAYLQTVGSRRVAPSSTMTVAGLCGQGVSARITEAWSEPVILW